MLEKRAEQPPIERRDRAAGVDDDACRLGRRLGETGAAQRAGRSDSERREPVVRRKERRVEEAMFVRPFYALSHERATSVDTQQLSAVGSQHMSVKSDVLHGTLDLIILKTLDAMGPLHGYAIARRIEQISSDQLAINQGTLYPALLKLGHRGWISTKWGQSQTGRRVKFYAITRQGQKQLNTEEDDWQRAAGIVTRFFKLAKAGK